MKPQDALEEIDRWKKDLILKDRMTEKRLEVASRVRRKEITSDQGFEEFMKSFKDCTVYDHSNLPEAVDTIVKQFIKLKGILVMLRCDTSCAYKVGCGVLYDIEKYDRLGELDVNVVIDILEDEVNCILKGIQSTIDDNLGE